MVEQKSGRRIRESLRALRHRNYRIYFFLLVSFMHMEAERGAKRADLQLTGSACARPAGFADKYRVLLSPLGGVMADRHRRHRIVILTQIMAMVQALLLASLTLSNRVTVGAVLALAVMLGVVNAFDMPTRQSFVVELVGKQDLMNAIALNSSMIQMARIGPRSRA